MRHTIMVLCLAGGMLPLGVSALQDGAFDPSATTPLGPQSIIHSADRLSDALQERFGVLSPSYAFRAPENVSAAEREAFYAQKLPYPKVTFEHTDKRGGPLSGWAPGVDAVYGYRYGWVSDAPNSARVERVLWRWEPPQDIKMRFPEWAGKSGIQRYWFLCLYPAGYRRKWLEDPVVLCFDSTSGLKWRTALPVVSSPGVALPPEGSGQRAKFSPSPDLRAIMGAAPDGQRVAVMVYPYPDQDMTWTYVLNGDGEIVQSVAVKDRDPSAASDGHILVAGAKGAFILGFRHPVPVDPEKPEGGSRDVPESYLIDRDGNFLRKFVDEEGRPVKISVSGERHALAVRPGKNGGWDHLIYKLP